MKLEIWTPQEEQLQRLAEDWMDRHMGCDWKKQWESIVGQSAADNLSEHAEERHSVKAILQWSDDICRFLMTAAVPERQCETLTEQLYRDSWGTALMDGGRQLLRDYVSDSYSKWKNGENAIKTPIVNKRFENALGGPGLNGVPLEEMKPLYEALEGWKIGISINSFGVLLPEKSCGGWFRREKETVDRRESECCHPGSGCKFCDRYGISCGGVGLGHLPE